MEAAVVPPPDQNQPTNGGASSNGGSSADANTCCAGEHIQHAARAERIMVGAMDKLRLGARSVREGGRSEAEVTSFCWSARLGTQEK